MGQLHKKVMLNLFQHPSFSSTSVWIYCAKWILKQVQDDDYVWSIHETQA